MIRRYNNQKVSTGNDDIVLYDVVQTSTEGDIQIGCILWNDHYWTVTRPITKEIWSVDIVRSTLSIGYEDIRIHVSESIRWTSPLELRSEDTDGFPTSYVERLRGSKHYGY